MRRSPRLKACIANCGPFDWGTVLPKMPKVSQEVFRVRSHSRTIEEAHARGRLLTLEGRSQNIKCPLLVVFGAGDRLISPAEGERLAKTASGPPSWSSILRATTSASTSATSSGRSRRIGWRRHCGRDLKQSSSGSHL
jgi:pimeloyl-ACP methyl ester carboxylesterase